MKFWVLGNSLDGAAHVMCFSICCVLEVIAFVLSFFLFFFFSFKSSRFFKRRSFFRFLSWYYNRFQWRKMRSLSSLGIGLSLVFGCLLLALVAELYYLLWWKKRIITNNRDIEADCSSPIREFFYLFCWKKKPSSSSSSLSSTALKPQELCNSSAHEQEAQLQLHSNSSKDLLLNNSKFFGEDDLETELMRLHNLSGPPRFLFTIKEETKEDLESEDGKSVAGKSRKGSRSKSLSDILLNVETPFLTPLSSPLITPPLTPTKNYNHHGFNPLFESSTEAELNRIRSSPPPKFKFLKDAEEKLYRRLMMEEAQKKVMRSGGSVENFKLPCTNSSIVAKDEDGSFITIYVSKNKDRDSHHHHHHHVHQYHTSSSSQVLPLTSSPSTIRGVDEKSIFHWNSKD